jgi:hypothetical protein
MSPPLPSELQKSLMVLAISPIGLGRPIEIAGRLWRFCVVNGVVRRGLPLTPSGRFVGWQFVPLFRRGGWAYDC